MNNGYDRQVYRMCINNYCPTGVENPTDAEVILEMHKKIEELTLKIREAEKADEWDDRPNVTIYANKKVIVMSEDKTIFGRAIRESHYKEGYTLLTVMYNDRHEDTVQLHHKEPK